MRRTRLFILGVGFGLVLPAAAGAQTAYTTKTVNLRAGPSREYELVAQVPAGSPVEVGGCVDDWSWCDVIVGPDRGWVYAGNLEYPYENRRVVIMSSGPLVGLPIEPFIVGTYWDTYYRGRPWYGRRSYWIGRPMPPHGVGIIRPSGPRLSGPRVAAPRPSGPRPAVRAAGPRSGAPSGPGPRPENRTRVQPARPAAKAPANRQPARPSNERKRPEKNQP